MQYAVYTKDDEVWFTDTLDWELLGEVRCAMILPNNGDQRGQKTLVPLENVKCIVDRDSGMNEPQVDIARLVTDCLLNAAQDPEAVPAYEMDFEAGTITPINAAAKEAENLWQAMQADRLEVFNREDR